MQSCHLSFGIFCNRSVRSGITLYNVLRVKYRFSCFYKACPMLHYLSQTHSVNVNLWGDDWVGIPLKRCIFVGILWRFPIKCRPTFVTLFYKSIYLPNNPVYGHHFYNTIESYIQYLWIVLTTEVLVIIRESFLCNSSFSTLIWSWSWKTRCQEWFWAILIWD